MCKSWKPGTRIDDIKACQEYLVSVKKSNGIQFNAYGLMRYNYRIVNKLPIHPIFGRLAISNNRALDTFKIMVRPRSASAEDIHEFITPIISRGGVIIFENSFFFERKRVREIGSATSEFASCIASITSWRRRPTLDLLNYKVLNRNFSRIYY